jgi:hypothetical protein
MGLGIKIAFAATAIDPWYAEVLIGLGDFSTRLYAVLILLRFSLDLAPSPPALESLTESSSSAAAGLIEEL